MRILLSLVALSCAIAGWYVSLKCKCSAADQRSSFAQSRANQCRREGILSSRLLSPRLLSSPLLWRLLSPWLRLWLWLSSPLLVALRSSHLPLVMRTQPFDNLKRWD